MTYIVGNARITKEDYLAPDDTGLECVPAGYFLVVGDMVARSFGWGPGEDHAEEADAFWSAVDWAKVNAQELRRRERGFTAVTL